MPREDRWDDIEQAGFAEERRARSHHLRCACGDDLPGRCPGPEVCPANRAGRDDEEEQDA